MNNSTASLMSSFFWNCLTIHTLFASTSSTKILMGCHHRNLNSNNIRQAGRSAIRSKRRNEVMKWQCTVLLDLKHPTKSQASNPCLEQLIQGNIKQVSPPKHSNIGQGNQSSERKMGRMGRHWPLWAPRKNPKFVELPKISTSKIPWNWTEEKQKNIYEGKILSFATGNGRFYCCFFREGIQVDRLV